MSKSVWVVTGVLHYEGAEPLKAFFSQEKAKRFSDTLNKLTREECKKLLAAFGSYDEFVMREIPIDDEE